MDELNMHIDQLDRSIDLYGKESCSAEEILEYLQAVKKAIEEKQS